MILSYEKATKNFYPRSPCGERLCVFCSMIHANVISIHALLAESDNERFKAQMCNFLFLSTLSLRRATFLVAPGYKSFRFLSTLSLRRATRFTHICSQNLQFLSTLSLRRATVQIAILDTNNNISIHALLAESDSSFRFLWC